jgi:hypothetical protein
VLHLAKQLPRLPTVDYGQVDQLAATIHRIVFVDPGSSQAGTPQALSDARHLSEAALGGASGYVTSDGRMLAVRDELLRQIGIDVASLDEFDALLPTALEASSDTQLHGTDCVIKGASVEIVRSYLDTHRAPVSVLSEFAPAPSAPGAWAAYSVSEGRQVVGIGVKIVPVSIDAPVRMLVHMRPDHVSCNVFADYLLDMQSREACAAGPTTIQLLSLPGQSAVRRAAVLRGLFQSRVLTP